MSTQSHASDGPSIAIIGTEGSGKTVLITALARALDGFSSGGAFLDPQGAATIRYVAQALNTLMSGEWPKSTAPGELFNLRWKLRVDGEPDCAVRLVDAAGQDLRQLFGDERIQQPEELKGSLRTLAAYCRSADIVLFLINLKDFDGQPDPLKRTDNELAIKLAMDYLCVDDRPRRFCLIFTQADLYSEAAQVRGGWTALAVEMIPIISGAYLRPSGTPASRVVPVFPVSAVNRTRIEVDEKGIPRRVPHPPFGSDGLEPVVAWLTSQAREIRRSRAAPTPPPLPVPAPEPTPPNSGPGWPIILRNAAAGVMGLIMLRSCAGGCSPAPPTVPIPVMVEARSHDLPGLIDDWVVSVGVVRNDGAAGYILVRSSVTENGREVDRQGQRLFLGAGESGRFRIELPGINAVRNPHEVHTDAIAIR